MTRPGTVEKLNSLTKYTVSSFISIIANLLPIQACGPIPNGSNRMLSPPGHRNLLGSNISPFSTCVLQIDEF